MPRDRHLGRWVLLGLALVVLGLGAVLVLRGKSIPDGPEPVAWNRQSCAHCRMAVGEPAHAAQLITTAGDVLFFDDPGCLLRYVDEHHPAVHRIWFHHAGEDRWLAADDTGFVTGATTPMGFGLAATERTTPGAIGLDQARQVVAGAGSARADVPPGGMP